MEGKQLYLFGSQKDAKKNENRFKLILSLDALILVGVIAIILLTLCFSLGIEQGKRIAEDTALRKKERLQEAKILANLDKSEQKFKTKKAVTTQVKKISPKVEKRYHIQVASFKVESTAKKAADKLKKQGYPILITKKGSYFVVYVGGFKTKVKAKNKLEILKKTYKDCILRRL